MAEASGTAGEGRAMEVVGNVPVAAMGVGGEVVALCEVLAGAVGAVVAVLGDRKSVV